jgi:hypothetical protein
MLIRALKQQRASLHLDELEVHVFGLEVSNAQHRVDCNLGELAMAAVHAMENKKDGWGVGPTHIFEPNVVMAVSMRGSGFSSETGKLSLISSRRWMAICEAISNLKGLR